MFARVYIAIDILAGTGVDIRIGVCRCIDIFITVRTVDCRIIDIVVIECLFTTIDIVVRVYIRTCRCIGVIIVIGVCGCRGVDIVVIVCVCASRCVGIHIRIRSRTIHRGIVGVSIRIVVGVCGCNRTCGCTGIICINFRF